MAKTTEEIVEMFQKESEIPRPARPLKNGTILDKTKSVLWNEEQVAISREKYKEEMKEYHRKRSEVYEKARQEAYLYIQENLDKEYSLEKCSILFSRAYSNGHAYGYNEVMSHVDDLIDFINDMDNEKQEVIV